MVDHVKNFFVNYSPHQYTPLHTAAREGHVDMVRYLVDKGADPNISRIFSVSERGTLLIVN